MTELPLGAEYNAHIPRRVVVPTANDSALYTEVKGEFKTWRTFQMSDHLPMWGRKGVDDAGDLAGRRSHA